VADLSVSFAASLVFAVLLYTYAIALAWAWRSSRREAARGRQGFRAKMIVLDHQTRPATTVTFFLAVSVVLGAIVGEQF
jgi:hypothetical protein